MSRKKDDLPWPMVMVPQKEWKALVRFFRREERIMRDSFSVPGREATWAKEYRKDDPYGFTVYDAARRAAFRKFGK